MVEQNHELRAINCFATTPLIDYKSLKQLRSTLINLKEHSPWDDNDDE